MKLSKAAKETKKNNKLSINGKEDDNKQRKSSLVVAPSTIDEKSENSENVIQFPKEEDTEDDDESDQFHSAPTTPTKSYCSLKDFCAQEEKGIEKSKDDEELPLHKSIFLNDHDMLKRLLEKGTENITLKDKHGNTPLHLACMLGRKKCIKLLLDHDATVKVKNNEGWTVLAEAISYGDRDTIGALLKKLRQQSRAHLESRRASMIKGLKQIQDFYMELKWDFTSWVPLVSRMLPSDVCRIHKCGTSLRLDTTLVDFNDMRWERGDISFIFRGDHPMNHSITVLDNEYQCYQHIHYEDSDIDDEVDILMSSDILAAHMSTKSIQFARAQSGWIFREDRKEVVGGQYQSELYSVQGLVLKQRKRREHLTQDDIQKNKTMLTTMSQGRRSSLSNSNSNSTDASTNGCNHIEITRRSSLPPPPKPSISWEQYISAETGKCPLLGRTPVHKQSNKSLKATVAMCKNFPLSVDMLLNILEVIAPFKHINKLREFVTLKLPPGFPVKVEIPVLHTVSAKITFQKFEFRDNISPTLFEIPKHYVEDSRRFPDL
ncbi:ankyrin repeat domain-containing protein 13C [Stomoxys calcitrans]|uniref:Ankyrin repeat domain-containing protein n=1 Tax=Stomoxys calcitrans TaxID=35570 RepID=A0A1I8P6V9_STOCA|nr:ankyrin repeat domain-containing protein 13C [Stomoxys calcitrans]XP_013100598.1 ankyrin repeat domain-containing protein 13C [Stomoxys calcitrans]